MIISGYKFDELPSPITVNGLELEVKVSKAESPGHTGNLQYEFSLSATGGSPWYDTKTVTLTSPPTLHVLGSSTDLWTKSSWSRAELQSPVFQVRATATGTDIVGSPEWRLHYAIPVVHYDNNTQITWNGYDSMSMEDDLIIRDTSPRVEETSIVVWHGRESMDFTDGGPTEKPSTLHLTATTSPATFPDGVLADFQTAIESTSSEHAFSVQMTIGTKIVLVSEPGFTTGADDVFQSGLLEIPEITHRGAAGTDSASSVGTATFSLTADVVESISSGEIETVAQLSQEQNLVGAPVTIRLHARTGPTATWVPFVLFKGNVEEVLFNEDRVEVSCRAETMADLPFPALRFKEDWLDGNDMGGKIVKNADGSVIPIGLGRFDLSAVKDDYSAGHPMAAATDNRSDITAVVPQMLGILHPALPTIAVWQKANPFTLSDAAPYFSKQVESTLLLFGESRDLLDSHGALRIETTESDSNSLIYPGPVSAPNYMEGGSSPFLTPLLLLRPPHEVRYNYSTFSSWTRGGEDRARGNPFLTDCSMKWSFNTGFANGGEFLDQSMTNGLYSLENASTAAKIAVLGGGDAKKTFPVVVTSSLGADNTKPYQAVLDQATAIPMEGFSKGIKTTHFEPDETPIVLSNATWPATTNKIVFETTTDPLVLNKEACLDVSDLTTFTTVPNGGSVALSFPRSASSLGKIKAFKVSWLTDGSQANKASRVYVATRMNPLSLFPLIRRGLNTDEPKNGSGEYLRWKQGDGGHSWFYRDCRVALTYDSSQYSHGSMWISGREFPQAVAQIKQSTGEIAWRSHGFVNPEAWEFISAGAEYEQDDRGVTISNTLLYQPEVVFFVGDPALNKNPSSGNFIDDPGKSLHLIAVWLEVIYESSFARYPEDWEPVETTDVRVRFVPREQRAAEGYKWVDVFSFRSNLDPRKPELTTPSLAPIYVSGRGPYGDPYGLLAGPNSADITAEYPTYTGALVGGAGLENKIVERGPDQAAYCILYHSRKAWDNRPMGILNATAGSFEAARAYISSNWLADNTGPHRLTCVFKDEGTLGEAIDRIAKQSFGFCQEQILNGTDQLVWRYFVDQPKDMNQDQPERHYRGDGYNFKWNDLWPNSFSATVTPIDQIANDFTLKYGFHLPTQKWAGTEYCTKDGTSFTVNPGLYKDICQDSINKYGIHKDVIEAPDVWDTLSAQALLKWHVLSKARRRVLVEFQTFVNAVDLQPGMIIHMDEEIGDRVKYPGVFGVDWLNNEFVVTSVVIQKDLNNLTRVQVSALETYKDDTFGLP